MKKKLKIALKKYSGGIIVSVILAMISIIISNFLPLHLISGSVFALIIGMILNPIISKHRIFSGGIKLVSKQVLRLAIVLMGLTLSFSQIISVGGYSLVVMCFTLLTAFGGGYILGKLFKMDWKLSSLISAGTGICGGSAVAAIAPTIEAKDSFVAYAISATFIFDVVMVIIFPLAGKYFGMSDMGFGLWAGTAVNDTSSVVAAGYAFSDAAGAYAMIVKLTRTLSIIPTVLIFSIINARVKRKEYISSGNSDSAAVKRQKVKIKDIFPFFILVFIAMVAIKSTGLLPDFVSTDASVISKFFMVMALGAIGLKTNFKDMAKLGGRPMIHGFVISALVVVVSFGIQFLLGQL